MDSNDDARDFLKRNPVPFPRFSDPGGKIARVFRCGRASPTSAFYRADGELAFTHAGVHPSQARLDADIRRYGLDG